MKDFKQRKAEIFRRSEERIRERKRRRRVTAVCIPLVLCISVVMLLPRQEASQPVREEYASAMGSNATQGPYISAGQMVGENQSYGMMLEPNQLLTVQLRSGDTVMAVKTGEAAEQILLFLEKMESVQESASKTTGDDNVVRSEVADETENVTIILCIANEAGAIQEFLWENTGLTDLETGIVYPLTVDQKKKLEALFE